jgi:hypothetical protein
MPLWSRAGRMLLGIDQNHMGLRHELSQLPPDSLRRRDGASWQPPGLHERRQRQLFLVAQNTIACTVLRYCVGLSWLYRTSSDAGIFAGGKDEVSGGGELMRGGDLLAVREAGSGRGVPAVREAGSGRGVPTARKAGSRRGLPAARKAGSGRDLPAARVAGVALGLAGG